VPDQTRLVVVACSSRATAEEALAGLHKLGIKDRDAVVVAASAHGRIELKQTHQVAAGEGVVGGGTVGFIAGMLLGGPIGGALLGMLGGGVWGARDTGVPDERLREMGASLKAGEALLCVLVASGGAAAVTDALRSYGEVADADASTVP
jgi:uncharacterized membrane protein